MYPSLIGAGVSKLYDLLQGATSGSTSSSNSSFSVPSSPTSSATPSPSQPSSSLSADLNQLFLDLQANQGAATPAAASGTGSTGSVASDLQNVFGDLKSAGAGHAHHHHPDNDGNAQSSGNAGSATANPFKNLAASLTAYANSQALTTSSGSTTSLTA